MRWISSSASWRQLQSSNPTTAIHTANYAESTCNRRASTIDRNLPPAWRITTCCVLIFAPSCPVSVAAATQAVGPRMHPRTPARPMGNGSRFELCQGQRVPLRASGPRSSMASSARSANGGRIGRMCPASLSALTWLWMMYYGCCIQPGDA